MSHAPRPADRLVMTEILRLTDSDEKSLAERNRNPACIIGADQGSIG